MKPLKKLVAKARDKLKLPVSLKSPKALIAIIREKAPNSHEFNAKPGEFPSHLTYNEMNQELRYRNYFPPEEPPTQLRSEEKGIANLYGVTADAIAEHAGRKKVAIASNDNNAVFLARLFPKAGYRFDRGSYFQRPSSGYYGYPHNHVFTGVSRQDLVQAVKALKGRK